MLLLACLLLLVACLLVVVGVAVRCDVETKKKQPLTPGSLLIYSFACSQFICWNTSLPVAPAAPPPLQPPKYTQHDAFHFFSFAVIEIDQSFSHHVAKTSIIVLFPYDSIRIQRSF